MHMYVYVHAHVWSKGQSQASFPGTLPTSFEHGLPLAGRSLIGLHWLSIKPKGSSCLCLHNVGLQTTTSGMFLWCLRTKLRSSSWQGKHFAIWASSHHIIKNSKSIFHIPFLLSNPHYILTAINRTSTLFPDANWPVQGHSMQISESGFGAFFCLASNGVAFPLSQGDWIWTKRSCLEREFKNTEFCSGNLKTQEIRRGQTLEAPLPFVIPANQDMELAEPSSLVRMTLRSLVGMHLRSCVARSLGSWDLYSWINIPRASSEAGHYCSLPQFALRPWDSH